MNTRTQNASLLIAASLGSLLFTVSAGATAANHKTVNVKTGNSVEAASPQNRYLIASGTVCTVKDPKPPLNVRKSPNGTKIGTLRNGTVVMIGSTQVDRKNLKWVQVSSDKPRLEGWVISSALTKCSRTP
jgi:hypothetical protein